ncbi:MAG: hypothetical protein AB7Q97_21495 [Gammaproteobacteria bacterium]
MNAGNASAIVAAILALVLASPRVGAADPGVAIVTEDKVALRAAPRTSARQQELLWRGDLLEVRGARLDYLQVYDHRRERGGYVHASLVRRSALDAADAPELLAVARFLRDRAGFESLGIALLAAYFRASPAQVLQSPEGTESVLLLGTFAERLADRASAVEPQPPALQTAIGEHLGVAAQYGIRMNSLESEHAVRLCYDGDAFRRVLRRSTNAVQQAVAALALTRPECVDPAAGPLAREAFDRQSAEFLDQVDSTALPPYLRNRVSMRRAQVWSARAFAMARGGQAQAAAGAQRAIAELADVRRTELTDADRFVYEDATMLVNASRWAVRPVPTNAAVARDGSSSLGVEPGEPGQSCVFIRDAEVPRELVRRCTWGMVWTASAAWDPQGQAAVIAVQPMAGWRELWVFRRDAGQWAIAVLPPAPEAPGIGYAEFAGWVPGGTHMLVARESRAGDRHQRSFERVRIETLQTEERAADPARSSAFRRWQDPTWKRETLSLR